MGGYLIKRTIHTNYITTFWAPVSPTRIESPDLTLAKRIRLDALVLERGLAPSRERARALILAGQVSVNGQVVSKAGAPTSADARVDLAVADHPYVSRGG